MKNNNWKHYCGFFNDHTTKCISFVAESLQVPMCCLLSAFTYEWVYTNGLLCPALEI